MPAQLQPLEPLACSWVVPVSLLNITQDQSRQAEKKQGRPGSCLNDGDGGVVPQEGLVVLVDEDAAGGEWSAGGAMSGGQGCDGRAGSSMRTPTCTHANCNSAAVSASCSSRVHFLQVVEDWTLHEGRGARDRSWTTLPASQLAPRGCRCYCSTSIHAQPPTHPPRSHPPWAPSQSPPPSAGW